MSDCDHKLSEPTTMYVGKIWYCSKCGQKMRCTEWCEHIEVDE